MSPLTCRAQPTRGLALLTITTAAALALTACASGSGTDSPTRPPAAASRTSPAPKGAVTPQDAAKIVDNYVKINNRSNATRNEKLLATVEAGQVNVQSRADYIQWKTWPKKDQKKYGAPFDFVNRSYYIPPATTASWFAVTATATTFKSKSLLFFDKVDGTYKLVMAFYANPGEEPIPKIALDRNGLATAVDPAQRTGAFAPAQLSSAYEDLFETGGARQGKQLTPTNVTRTAVKIYQKSKKGTAGGKATKKFFAQHPDHTKVYALRTADGGVLTAFPTAHTQESLIKPRYRSSYDLIPNKIQSLYSATRGPVITDDFQGQALAELTPKSSRVISIEWHLVDAR
ncbi:hypothetical protein ABZ864_47775 [Streptomyces sp. NPDC047082]|uniref:hypothetical protein n=1 Tax=Streptomyces sp. NPDC047082 TaxID=3155259 RepID=UPI0033D8AE4D